MNRERKDNFEREELQTVKRYPSYSTIDSIQRRLFASPRSKVDKRFCS